MAQSKFKKPLKRSVSIGCFLVAISISIIISIISYNALKAAVLDEYEARMTDILNHVSYNIDSEDLAMCVETFQPSDKYWELQDYMDSFMETMKIHFLYIIVPLDTEESGNVYNILSADTKYGRTYEPDGYELGTLLEDIYTYDEIMKYYNAMQVDEISFFETRSDWGDDYTGIKPLKDANANTYAILCVDFEISEIRKFISIYTMALVSSILISSFAFAVIFIRWLGKYITNPIIALEKSVDRFAALTHDQRDPSLLIFDDPGISTQNEVEALANSMSQMAMDIKAFIQNLLNAEEQVQDMKSQVTRMDMLAYQDALTHVKNKAWYDTIEERINEDIEAGIAKFAIIMTDFNDLKTINDNYGHDCGNQYIVGATKMICDICEFSAVFRVGGDEFVILLENKAYEDKDILYNKLISAFKDTATDESRQPWARYSAAFGMASFSQYDTCMDDVFKRADKLMYDNKQRMKSAGV